MKAIKAKAMVKDEMEGAMEELRESIKKVAFSALHKLQRSDWKKLAPKVIMGLVLLYGATNRKIITSIVTSVIIGMVSNKVVPQTANA